MGKVCFFFVFVGCLAVVGHALSGVDKPKHDQYPAMPHLPLIMVLQAIVAELLDLWLIHNVSLALGSKVKLAILHATSKTSQNDVRA